MGLDNIPHRYPCKTGGTAVMTPDGKIDCDATREAGGCPLIAARLGAGAVYGMLGVPCWYRGKVADGMIGAVTATGADLPADIKGGFYGDGERLAPDYCNRLAAWMEDHGELYLSTVPAGERKNAAEMYRYAVRWLRWVAEHCDGAVAWW